VGATQRGSISPMCIRSPFAAAWMAAEPSATIRPSCQETAARGGVAPEERWGGHVGRKDRAVGRIVDDDAGGPVLRAGRRHTEPGQKVVPE